MDDVPIETDDLPVRPALQSMLARQRDRIAGVLITLGVTPNALTIGGCLLTVAASACLVAGAGHAPPWEAHRAPTPASGYPLLCGVILTFALVLDVLDGAVARLGGMISPFGALLDSTLDRISDLAIFGGCALYFAKADVLAGTVLSLTALGNALLISYVKARAENLIEDCTVGAWQRGERSVVFLVATYSGHVPTALWILGTLPVLTVIRRLDHSHKLAQGRPEDTPRFIRFMGWRHPRGSMGYNISAAVVLGFVVIAPWLNPLFY